MSVCVRPQLFPAASRKRRLFPSAQGLKVTRKHSTDLTSQPPNSFLTVSILAETKNKYNRKPIEYLEMATPAIGTQVQLVFRTQFLTFTAELFSKALKEKKYLEVRGQIPNPQNPQAPPIPIQTFSKGNVTVFLPLTQSLSPNAIVFEILNTINLEPMYKEEVKSILTALNIFPDIVSDASFNCTTRTKAKTRPLDRLTSMIDQIFLERISKNFAKKLQVCSIRLATAFPLEREGGFQVVVEPLATNPEKEYYLNIAYKTTKMNEFDKFISEFGSDMIQRIMEETTKNV